MSVELSGNIRFTPEELNQIANDESMFKTLLEHKINQVRHTFLHIWNKRNER